MTLKFNLTPNDLYNTCVWLEKVLVGTLYIKCLPNWGAAVPSAFQYCRL